MSLIINMKRKKGPIDKGKERIKIEMKEWESVIIESNKTLVFLIIYFYLEIIFFLFLSLSNTEFNLSKVNKIWKISESGGIKLNQLDTLNANKN